MQVLNTLLPHEKINETTPLWRLMFLELGDGFPNFIIESWVKAKSNAKMLQLSTKLRRSKPLQFGLHMASLANTTISP
jgi:hypothetical protein